MVCYMDVDGWWARRAVEGRVGDVDMYVCVAVGLR